MIKTTKINNATKIKTLISALPTIKEIVRGFSARKKLGQNYIVDQSITDNIIKSIGNLNNKLVLEIGPGIGTLTRSIIALSDAPAIIAIEKDEQFKTILEQLKTYSDRRLHIIFEDALKFDLINDERIKSIAVEHKLNEVAIVANLPYNIGTCLINQWLDLIYQEMRSASSNHGIRIASITVMLQLEVVNRLIAQPKTKEYGLLSIMAQWLCNVEKLFIISPEVFWPSPKITSAVAHIKPKYDNLKLECAKGRLADICKATFMTRRKTLRNSLKTIALNNRQLTEYLEANPNIRPEEISVQEFTKIAAMLTNGK